MENSRTKISLKGAIADDVSRRICGTSSAHTTENRIPANIFSSPKPPNADVTLINGPKSPRFARVSESGSNAANSGMYKLENTAISTRFFVITGWRRTPVSASGSAIVRGDFSSAANTPSMSLFKFGKRFAQTDSPAHAVNILSNAAPASRAKVAGIAIVAGATPSRTTLRT